MQSWISSIFTPVQCDMILQKSFEYADLVLKNLLLLLLVLKTFVLPNIFEKTEIHLYIVFLCVCVIL